MKLLYILLIMYFSIISLQAIEYYEEDDVYEYTNNYIDRSRDFCSELFANPVNEYALEYKTTCENAFDITNTVESYYLNHDVVYKNRICSQVDSETNSGDSVVFLTYQKTLLCRYECSSSVVCAAGLVKDPNTCECVSPPSLLPDDDYDSDGVPNKCDREFAFLYPNEYNSYDCDGDGILNGFDLDDDDDSLVDVDDKDNANYERDNIDSRLSESTISEENCIVNYSDTSSLGTVELIGWDSITQTCKYLDSTCVSGTIYDLATDTCIFPPENNNLGLPNECLNDNWALRNTFDYCSMSVGICLPLGYESFDTDCGKKYLEYQCVADYTIVRLLEVSCGLYVPSEDITNDLLIDGLPDTELLDSNGTTLPTTTSGDLQNHSDLVNILTSIKDGYSKLDKLDVTSNSINDGISTANSSLDSIDNKLSTSNALLQDIKNGIDSKDTNGTYEEDSGQKGDREATDGILDDIYNTLSNIQSDYENISSSLNNGLVNVSMSSGTEPEFCAIVFGKQICVNLCDSFGTFYSIFYYIFTSVFMLASLRLYYSAFKMR